MLVGGIRPPTESENRSLNGLIVNFSLQSHRVHNPSKRRAFAINPDVPFSTLFHDIQFQ